MIAKQSVYKLALLILPMLLIGFWIFSDSLNTLVDVSTNAQCEYLLDIPTYHVAVSPAGIVWVVTNDSLLAFADNTWQSHPEPYKYFKNVLDFFIEFDSEGRLWIGSGEGIIIYDGESWEIHTNYEWGLPRTEVTALTFDSDGRAWIGLASSGAEQDDPGGRIAIFDGKDWHLFSIRFGGTIADYDITEVQFDSFGQLWIGTSGGTIAKLEIIDNLNEQFSGTENNFIMSYVDEDGLPHYLTYAAQVYHRYSSIPSPNLGEVYGIEFDQKGDAWIYIHDILYRFDGHNFDVMAQSEWRGTGGIAIDPQGNIWFGPQVYDGEKWRTYNSLNSCIRNNRIHNIDFDRNGTTWISQEHHPGRIGLTAFEGNPQQTPSFILFLRRILIPREPVGWIFPVSIALVWIFIYLKISLPFSKTLRDKNGQKNNKARILIPGYEDLATSRFLARWIGISIVATVIGYLLGFLISLLFSCLNSAAGELIGAVVWGSAIGAVIGFAQSKFFYYDIQEPARWVYANMIAWAGAIFFFEVNEPIVRCWFHCSSKYDTASLIRSFHKQLFTIGSQLESVIGHAPVDKFDSAIGRLLYSSSHGLFWGLSQGISQWWTLRLEIPRSKVLVAVNVFIWVVVFNVGALRTGRILSIEFLLLALLLPTFVTGLTILLLQRNRNREAEIL